MKSFNKFLFESNQWIRISANRAVKLYPVLADVSRDGLKKLLLIDGPNDINDIDNHAWWMDDSQECFGISINGVNVGFWWEDPRLKEKFADKDKKATFEALKQQIARTDEDEVDGPKLDEIRKEIEYIKKLKPETQKHFGGILREL